MKRQFTGISWQDSKKRRINMSPINLHERSLSSAKGEKNEKDCFYG